MDDTSVRMSATQLQLASNGDIIGTGASDAMRGKALPMIPFVASNDNPAAIPNIFATISTSSFKVGNEINNLLDSNNNTFWAPTPNLGTEEHIAFEMNVPIYVSALMTHCGVASKWSLTGLVYDLVVGDETIVVEQGVFLKDGLQQISLVRPGIVSKLTLYLTQEADGCGVVFCNLIGQPVL